VNSHQVGTFDSWVDRNEQGIKPETYRGYRKKLFRKMTEDLKWIRYPQISVENTINIIPRQVLYMCSPLRLVRLWRGYLRYLSAHDLVFIPCVRGGSHITFMFTGIFTLPSSDSYVCFIALKSFLSNLNQHSSID
jgi:hypothetical protein